MYLLHILGVLVSCFFLNRFLISVGPSGKTLDSGWSTAKLNYSVDEFITLVELLEVLTELTEAGIESLSLSSIMIRSALEA